MHCLAISGTYSHILIELYEHFASGCSMEHNMDDERHNYYNSEVIDMVKMKIKMIS